MEIGFVVGRKGKENAGGSSRRGHGEEYMTHHELEGRRETRSRGD